MIQENKKINYAECLFTLCLDTTIPKKDVELEPLYDIDGSCKMSYFELYQRLYGTEFSFLSACQNNYLVTDHIAMVEHANNHLTVNPEYQKFKGYTPNEYALNIAIWINRIMHIAANRRLKINYKWRKNLNIILLPDTDIENAAEKGYFVLSTDSDSFPGFSWEVSQQIVLQASAIYRITHANYKFESRYFDYHKIYKKYQSSTTFAYKLSDVATFKDDMDIAEELDFKECMLGDIEAVTPYGHPVFCTFKDSTELLVVRKDELTNITISPTFGTQMRVVTNPDALLDRIEFRYGTN